MMDTGRRAILKWLGLGAVGCSSLRLARAATPVMTEVRPLPTFTGPGANPYWNSVGELVTYPQKLPLILLTDRPVQLETPRPYFLTPITPNAAFYVRWHLDGHPQSVDLAAYRLRVEGAVGRPSSFSYAELLQRFAPVSITAVNQCSGNSRSFVTPRVPGSQWGHGAMGCAQFTGVRLRDVLDAVVPHANALQVQFVGMEQGRGPPGKGSYQFAKSLDVTNAVLDECVLAYAMNGAPLPLLNGFPLRLVVPGFFATYWVKALACIRLLTEPDTTWWMRHAYLTPATPRGTISPEEAAAGTYQRVPLGRMPVRAFLVTPDGSDKIPAGFAVTVQGVACSGHGGVSRVDVSADGGTTWHAATLGPDVGTYAFRPWSFVWRPPTAGRYTLVVRAADSAGNRQSDDPFWNPSGYGYCRLDRQEVTVGLV